MMIGFLDRAGRNESPLPIRAFHKGLSEQGFV
jgi:hypothetical protein